MVKKIRDIIKPHMTVFRFMFNESAAEGYFQSVCQSAFQLSEYGDKELHHPYSFGKMKDCAKLLIKQ